MKCYLIVIFLSVIIKCNYCNVQSGPDPWDYDHKNLVKDELHQDLQLPPVKKPQQVANTVVMNEWFFKRLLTILMKSGKTQKDEEGNVNIKLEINLSKEQWSLLETCVQSDKIISEDMYRRAVGYIQDATVKPTIRELFTETWTEYVQIYIAEYKVYIVAVTGASAVISIAFYIWNHVSHRHIIFFLFSLIYLYEAFISYKEAEVKEYERFISVISSCKWYFWSSTCDIPPPDPLIFIKHMHPLKILLRIFTILVSEPIVTISYSVKTMVHGVTDGLWYPLDKIVFCILVLMFNGMLVMFLIMILFNYILNTPFNFSLLAGLINIGVQQRDRNFRIPSPAKVNNNEPLPPIISQGDRLSGENIDKLLSFCALAIKTTDGSSSRHNSLAITNPQNHGMRRSSSTGRLRDSYFPETNTN